MNDLLFSTEDLAKMFQVGQTTIKRWADEGKLKCIKTPGGHRKFKPSAVDEFIMHYNYEIVTPLLPFARTSESIRPDAVMVVGETLLNECFINAIKGKNLLIEQTFSSLSSQGKTLPAIFDFLLTPVLQLIQEKHQHRQITPVEFQIGKNTLLTSLIHFADRIPKSEKKEFELHCLTAHDGMNEVELKAVELLLDNMGVTVYNLGTVLTKYTSEDIVNYCKPEDVFIVLSLDHASDEVVHQFNSFVTGVRSYGGNVFTSSFFDKDSTEVVTEQSKKIFSYAEIFNQFSLTTQVA
ncbi:MAG: helix-turn-helix domain-containing protein [Bacteroidota bacterium]